MPDLTGDDDGLDIADLDLANPHAGQLNLVGRHHAVGRLRDDAPALLVAQTQLVGFDLTDGDTGRAGVDQQVDGVTVDHSHRREVAARADRHHDLARLGTVRADDAARCGTESQGLTVATELDDRAAILQRDQLDAAGRGTDLDRAQFAIDHQQGRARAQRAVELHLARRRLGRRLAQQCKREQQGLERDAARHGQSRKLV
mmetsp:Transcript_70458/g.166078  ORF Transcript_70458/g.166078 Transcript_70458/m.166078 type:complete len:201 (+) Transcript_70458:1468-2070(+)